MRITLAPTVDELMSSLQGQGWSMGDTAHGVVWLVTGTKSSQYIKATGKTRLEAWEAAVEQARILDREGCRSN